MLTPSGHGRFPGGDMSVDYSAAARDELNGRASEVVEHDGFFRFEGATGGWAGGSWVVDLLLPHDVDEERDAEMLADLRGMVR